MRARLTELDMKCFTKLVTLLAIVIASVVEISAPQAATAVWTGANSALWSDAANWQGGILPVAGDDLVFPPGAATGANINDFSAGTTFQSISFTGHDYAVD